MNDEQLEQNLRQIPAPELPAIWRAEILATALRESHVSETQRPNRPALLFYLRTLVVRNPITATALTTLWILIFLFKATTPVDPAEREMLAHIDPNKPIHLVDLATEIRLAELLQQPDSQTTPRIP